MKLSTKNILIAGAVAIGVVVAIYGYRYYQGMVAYNQIAAMFGVSEQDIERANNAGGEGTHVWEGWDETKPLPE